MVNYTYHLARSVEAVSCAVGAGEFEIDPDSKWLCTLCAAHQDAECGSLCARCQASWLDELTVLEYSDAFERRINVSIGISALLMSSSALLANASLGLWEQGAMIATLTSFLASSFKALNTGMEADVGLRALFDYGLVITFVLSFLAVVANTLVAAFVMGMNPRSERHWRDMNAGVYAVLFAQTCMYGVVLYLGVTVSDIVCVVVPFVLGTGALGCAAFVRGQRLEDLEGLIRLGGDEREGMWMGEEEILEEELKSEPVVVEEKCEVKA